MTIWNEAEIRCLKAAPSPTDAYEHIIMLTKSAHYYWDADAVREPSTRRQKRS